MMVIQWNLVLENSKQRVPLLGKREICVLPLPKALLRAVGEIHPFLVSGSHMLFSRLASSECSHWVCLVTRTVGICVYAKVFVTVSGLCSIRIKSLRSIYLLSFAVYKGYCEPLSLIPQCQRCSRAQIAGLFFPCRKTIVSHHFEIIYFKNNFCPFLRMFSLVGKSGILKCSWRKITCTCWRSGSGCVCGITEKLGN